MELLVMLTIILRCTQSLNDILKTLENETNKLLDSFQNYYFKLKYWCHLISSLN